MSATARSEPLDAIDPKPAATRVAEGPHACATGSPTGAPAGDTRRIDNAAVATRTHSVSRMRQNRGMPIRDFLGWLLFLASAVLFGVSGARAGDPLVVAGSAVFGFACLLFLSHALPARGGDS